MRLTMRKGLLATLVLVINWASYCFLASYFQASRELRNSGTKQAKETKDERSPSSSPTSSPTVSYSTSPLEAKNQDAIDNREKKSLFSNKRKKGYANRGGQLPVDGFPHYPNPASWAHIDNGTCIVEEGESEGPLFEWQIRAPHAILLGAMKGGTHALSEYLWEHPLVAAPKNRENSGFELHFYDGNHFHRDKHGIPRRKNLMSYAFRVQSKYPDLLYSTKEKFTIHDSPRYLLWSDRIPEAILCVTPWAKLMAVLRDPVERVVSHYRFQDEGRRKKQIPMVDWERWVEDDIRLLRKAGVLRNWTEVDFDQFAGSDEELLAWKRYVRTPNSQMLVGRGLYAIQIEHYFAAMDRAGKPRSDFLALRSEDLRRSTQEVYDAVLDFLGLPPFELSDKSAKHETRKDSLPLPEHLRAKLEQLYEPYNQRLCSLLEWNECWPYHDHHNRQQTSNK